MNQGDTARHEPPALDPLDPAAGRSLEERVEAIENALELACAIRHRLGRRGSAFVGMMVYAWRARS